MPVVIYSKIELNDQVSAETIIGLELFFEHTDNWTYEIYIDFTDGSNYFDTGNGDIWQYNWTGGKKISSILVHNINIDNIPSGGGVWLTDTFYITELCVKTYSG